MIGDNHFKATASQKIIHQQKNFQLQFDQFRTGILIEVLYQIT